jgi:hypothetical protein
MTTTNDVKAISFGASPRLSAMIGLMCFHKELRQFVIIYTIPWSKFSVVKTLRGIADVGVFQHRHPIMGVFKTDTDGRPVSYRVPY